MSAHPAPRATRLIRAETAGSSGLALGPNQRGKAGGEVEASIPVMAMVHQTHPTKGSAGRTHPPRRGSIVPPKCHSGRGGPLAKPNLSARSNDHILNLRNLSA